MTKAKILNIKTKSYIAIIMAMVFWSFSFIWFKEANLTFHPITIVFLRLLFSVILLSPYLLLTNGFQKIKKKDWKLFIILAVFEPFIYFLGESFGLTYVSATVCSVMISTIPVFATIGARVIFKEKLKSINYAGIILSFLGVIVFVLNLDGSLSFSVKGLLLLLLAVFSAVGYNLTLSKIVKKYEPGFIVNVQNIIGATLFLPIFLFLDLKHFTGLHLTPGMFLPILKLAFFASCGAFILFAWSVDKMGISKANVFSNCIPVFTAIFAFFIIDDKLTLQNIIGMTIVISGLLMSQWNGRKTKFKEALTLTGKTA
jgi:drug/metabolite transporter (DMT)-like permease